MGLVGGRDEVLIGELEKLETSRMVPDADRGGSEGESTSTSASMVQHMPELREQPRLAGRAGAPCSPAGLAPSPSHPLFSTSRPSSFLVLHLAERREMARAGPKTGEKERGRRLRREATD